MIDRAHLSSLLERERKTFVERNPRSRKLYERSRRSLVGGVPMNWMTKWAGPFPVFAERAEGARVHDVDGHEYIDFCLGDSGAMTGHAPPGAVDAIVDQLRRGTTMMLPTDRAPRVGEELARRFGLPYWQFTLTATDANRFALRLARAITGKPKILVFNWCYHGSVDEALIRLSENGTTPARGNVGPPVDPALTTRIVEFNDLDALERELAFEDVACVLAEPALTNIGIVHPQPGFHAALRELTTRHGALLILDETHTLCAGPGGCTGADGLEPDLVTMGKPIGSGVPSGAYGIRAEHAERAFGAGAGVDSDWSGVGGTLAANALSMAAMAATLENVLTPAAYEGMIARAERFETAAAEIIARHGLPWHMSRLGCRVEYRYAPTPPVNGSEAVASTDCELDDFTHLYALNRGVLMTPFHNMALMSPATTDADVDRCAEVFEASVQELTAS